MDVDFAAVTTRQQVVWSMGDYGRVGSLLAAMGEGLVRELDVHALERVLDVAAGNGNASLPAARRFAEVISTDYVPALLLETQRRAAAEGLLLRTEVADVQSLPYEDASFDVVMSTIGAMFAPDQHTVAREITRVCRRGGRIGMANWTPDSLVGDLLRTLGRHVPPPAGVRPPVSWGTAVRVHELLDAHCTTVRTTVRTCPWRFPSAQACLDYFREWFGPIMAAFAAVGPEGQEALADDLLSVFRGHGASPDGTFAADVAYLELIAIRS